MPAHSDLDVRMKENYEHRYRFKLLRRMPVIVRIDGKAFHTFTKGFEKPFDKLLVKTMQDTMKYLCENVEGCKLGYTQSDEISLLLIDYDTFQTQPYFDYNIQKISSITASMATLEFNRKFKEYILEESRILYENLSYDYNCILGALGSALEKDNTLLKIHQKAIEKGAMFDSRCFNIPREEVTNYFFSRQIDASRNSVEMVGRAYFSHNELYQKNGSMIQDMLHEKYNVNWNDFPTELKRGSCCIKSEKVIKNDDNEIIRSEWIIDHEIPEFKGEGREYIDKYINIDQDT